MTKRKLRIGIVMLLLIIILIDVSAAEPGFNPDSDYAQVESVRMVYRSGEKWDVHVAVFHNDEGWDHYANVWQIVDAADGTVIGERVLAHPHDNEQPFTRSLSGVTIDSGTRGVIIRSRCNLHEYGGKEIRVEIPEDPEAGLILNISE